MNRYVVAALTLFAVIGAVALYARFKPAPMPPGVHLPATPAPELKREQTIPVQVAEPIQVYKPAVKKKLKLPPAVQADPEQHVVASTKTANDERQHTVTTTLDTRTGEFTTYDRVEPLPWLAVSTRSHFGAYIGAMNGEQALAVTARQEVLRIKGLRVEGVAIGAVSQSERFTFVGVGASW